MHNNVINKIYNIVCNVYNSLFQNPGGYRERDTQRTDGNLNVSYWIKDCVAEVSHLSLSLPIIASSEPQEYIHSAQS